MIKQINLISFVVLFSILNILTVASKESNDNNNESLRKGQTIAFDRKKGNCLACHHIPGGTLMGNTGPALIAMKQRFPKQQDLIDQIGDARMKNSMTIMPPFGPHGILTQNEILLIADWLYTL